jgi:hypothetical protein
MHRKVTLPSTRLMSASGQTRSFGDVRVTSAFPPIATEQRTQLEVRVGPRTDISWIKRLGETRINRAVNATRRADKILGSFATDARTFFGHRTFHQKNDEGHREYHDGE